MTAPLRLGTRGSLLARTQSQEVADALTSATGLPVELVTIKAEGDDVSLSLTALPRPGAFVATLRDALLDSRVDLVVHSMKDLPSAPLPGLTLAAVPRRENPADALCARDGLKLTQLPAGALVGTSSPRRTAGLLRRRPDLQIVPMRGNVDTRLQRVSEGVVDAVLLAAAGLFRLGRQSAITELIDPKVLLPAPAQGALAVECRVQTLESQLISLDDERTRLLVTAERAVLAGVEATCTTAVGALAHWVSEDELLLTAELSGHRGVEYAHGFRAARVGGSDSAVALGTAVADDLLAG